MNFKRIFCRHDWMRTSDRPTMVPDEESMCSFEVQYTCMKCNKVKDTWSDTYLGMRIIESVDEIRERKLKELGI